MRALDFIDKYQVIRRLVLLWVVIGLTTRTLEWTIEFARFSMRPGLEVAAIIAAIWTPMTALQAAVIGFYNSSRKENA